MCLIYTIMMVIAVMVTTMVLLRLNPDEKWAGDAGKGVPVAAVVQEAGHASAQVQQDVVHTPAQGALVPGADPDDQSDQQLEGGQDLEGKIPDCHSIEPESK